MKKPRTAQFRTVTFWRDCTSMPIARVVAPAGRPPILKPLQSIVTLLTPTEMAVPDARLVDRSCVRQ